LDQLDSDVVGDSYKSDALTGGGVVAGAFEQLGAQAGQALDLRLKIGCVDAEVLETPVGVGVAGAHLFVGSRTRDVDDYAVLALAAHEAVAARANSVTNDREAERLDVPIGGLLWIRGFQVDVVDAKGHGTLLTWTSKLSTATAATTTSRLRSDRRCVKLVTVAILRATMVHDGLRRPALFTDLDSTVRETFSGNGFPLDPDDQLVLPHVAERLREARSLGYLVIGVTNQGGVAFGELEEEDVRAINRRLAEGLLPGLFDDILFCPHHVRGWRAAYRQLCPARKPGPAMAFEAARRHGIELSLSVMVGDRPTDREFATAAGVGRFFWARDFFVAGVSMPGWSPIAAGSTGPSLLDVSH
jgi:D-glycero-D-manno-heptose 1,7-bisphosphate phosphatase